MTTCGSLPVRDDALTLDPVERELFDALSEFDSAYLWIRRDTQNALASFAPTRPSARPVIFLIRPVFWEW